MDTRTVRRRLVLVLALLVFAMFAATSSAFACVVGLERRLKPPIGMSLLAVGRAPA